MSPLIKYSSFFGPSSGHPPEAVQVQRSLPLQELDCHIAVRRDSGLGQPQLFPQRPVVLDYPVVGQGKGSILDTAQKGVVVAVTFFTPLGGHAGVPHHHPGVPGNLKPHGMGGPWTLVDMELSPAVVGDSGGVRSPYLTSRGEYGENPVSFPSGQAVSVVDQAE